MKIGTVKDEDGFGRWGDDCYKKMKEYGFSCADFDMADTNGWVYNSDEEEVAAKFSCERKLAEAAGVEIWQVHGPWVFPIPEVTEEGRKKHVENLKKSIYFTSVLGCHNWVVHPLMPYWVDDLETGNADKTWEINVDVFRELSEFAKQYNITICIENMPFKDYSISRPEEILKLVKTINRDNVKICLDTGHVGIFEDLSVGDAVRLFGKEIRVLHIHDTKPGQDLHIRQPWRASCHYSG